MASVTVDVLLGLIPFLRSLHSFRCIQHGDRHYRHPEQPHWTTDGYGAFYIHDY